MKKLELYLSDIEFEKLDDIKKYVSSVKHIDNCSYSDFIGYLVEDLFLFYFYGVEPTHE